MTSADCEVQVAKHGARILVVCTLLSGICDCAWQRLHRDAPDSLGDGSCDFPRSSAFSEQAQLANDQDAIKARYKRFNLTLQQMAEILRKQDPERADLLFRALGRSQETRIEDQMNLIFALLNKEQPQLGEAIDRQEELVGQLKNLLDLLQSEDRRSRHRKGKAAAARVTQRHQQADRQREGHPRRDRTGRRFEKTRRQTGRRSPNKPTNSAKRSTSKTPRRTARRLPIPRIRNRLPNRTTRRTVNRSPKTRTLSLTATTRRPTNPTSPRMTRRLTIARSRKTVSHLT